MAILVNSTETIPFTWQFDGVATDPSPQTTTVTVTKEDGTEVVANAATTRTGLGTFTYTPPVQTALDRLRLDWKATFSGNLLQKTTQVEIVGGYYVSLAELRAMPNLSDTTKFPVAKLIDARQWFETTFERYTGRAFVPRYKRLVLWGSGGDSLQLPDEYLRTLRAVTFGTVNLSATALANTVAEASGRIQRYWPSSINGTDTSWGSYGSTFPIGTRVTVAYEYGMDAAPDDVREAAKTAIWLKLMDDQPGRREYAAVTDVGIIRFSRPGADRPFGVEEVDRVANDRRRSGWNSDRLTVGSVPI